MCVAIVKILTGGEKNIYEERIVKMQLLSN